MNSFDMVIRRKLAAVGDAIGKSCAILTYVQDEFTKPTGTIIERHITDVEVKGTCVEVEIWEYSGHDRYAPLRTSSYKDIDVFLIFFANQVRSSFENVTKIWLPEIKGYSQNVPYVLVGATCIDPGYANIASSMEEAKVTSEEGRALAREIKAVDYVECWAECKYNVEEVFVRAVEATL